MKRAAERGRGRCRERLEALADAPLTIDELRAEAAADLSRTLGFSRWCWPISDPTSLLAHSGVAQVDYWALLPRMIVLDQADSPLTRPSMVRRRRAAFSLHAATRGDLARDARWRECQEPFGMGDELTTACSDQRGCWGWLSAHRDSDERPFDADEVRFAAEVAPILGRALRQALGRVPLSRATAAAPASGVLVIDRDLHMTSWTPSVEEWLRTIPGGTICESAGILPTAVYSTASRALAQDSPHSDLSSRIRVRTTTGRWATLDSGRLQGEGAGQVAVTIRAASPEEILSLLALAYGLTTRESQLLSLVVTGLSTRELAEHLHISAHTVKDHLKAVFAKVGVRSRRQLVADVLGVAATEGGDAGVANPAGLL